MHFTKLVAGAALLLAAAAPLAPAQATKIER